MARWRPVIFPAALLLVGACTTDPTTSPVNASDPSFITGGAPTGPAFGHVGALLWDADANGAFNATELLCSGTLIAPTVFLTAAHCVTGLGDAPVLGVSFSANLVLAPVVMPVVGMAADPGFGKPGRRAHDLAVVFLPQGATTGISPAALPPAGLLEALNWRGGLRGQEFLNVGYGYSASRHGPPGFRYDGQRNGSRSLFQSLQPETLSLLMNQRATGLGGDCYGDSGGPKYLAEYPALIVAVVSWGDGPCRALSVNTRLDTRAARAFLGAFVDLP